MIFLVTLPFRLLALGIKIGAGSVKLGHRTLRLVGYGRILTFGAGVAAGLLFAPGPGEKLRQQLREALEGLGGPPGGDLADQVRDALASAPRTWTLPQPAVSVEGGRVVLSGDVASATASGDLERAARTVKGVVEVENRLRIVAADG